MNLQAKLTLGYVVLAVVMVGVISAVDLANNMQEQFDATLERAEVLKPVATKFVRQTLNRSLTMPLREALRDPVPGSDDLLDLLTDAHAILEIAVVDPKTNEVLADSDPATAGRRPPARIRISATWCKHTGWLQKLQRAAVARDRTITSWNSALGTPPGETVLAVRVIIAPALIRARYQPDAGEERRRWRWLSVIGAICITFLFSALAFRPLGRLRRQLDLVARGEYEPEKPRRQAAPPTSFR